MKQTNPSIATIKKHVAEFVRRELPSTKVVKVNMYESESSIDGAPLLHIDVIFEGERPASDECGNLMLRTHDYFRGIKNEIDPLFTFLTTEDALDYYDPVKKWPVGYYEPA